MDDKLFSSLEKNKERLDKYFENSADYFYKPVSVMGCNCAVVMCEDLTDSLKLWEVFLSPLNNLNDVKNSFNSYPLDRLAQAIGKASVMDSDYIKENAKKIIATRERVSARLKELGFVMPESRSNFIFVKHPSYDANKLFKELRDQHILVRHFNAPRIDQYLRISIGTDEQMDELLKAIENLEV